MTREEINHKKQQRISMENEKELASSIIKKIMKIILILFIAGIIFFAYTTYVSTAIFHVREYRIINSKIPDNFNGIKIIQFSDLHYGSNIFDENIKKIKKEINKRKPDIIVFTGDLIDKNYKITKEEKETLAKKLKGLDAKLGKYAILGNEDNEDITTIYNQSDFITLKNEYDLIYNKNNNPILLIGLSSKINKEQNIQAAYSYFEQENINNNIYTITLVHEPDSTIDILKYNDNTDLILAGHSHNGNVRIPFVNIPLETVKEAKVYNEEYYKINNTDLYISSGLGTNNKSGIRLFCRPTISLYRLSNK